MRGPARPSGAGLRSGSLPPRGPRTPSRGRLPARRPPYPRTPLSDPPSFSSPAARPSEPRRSSAGGGTSATTPPRPPGPALRLPHRHFRRGVGPRRACARAGPKRILRRAAAEGGDGCAGRAAAAVPRAPRGRLKPLAGAGREVRSGGSEVRPRRLGAESRGAGRPRFHPQGPRPLAGVSVGTGGPRGAGARAAGPRPAAGCSASLGLGVLLCREGGTQNLPPDWRASHGRPR